ncbi:MAG TPA: AAA family ATPase, partial [Candidatus Ozemobacteraceae bacterium]|nr:AAA family ATPase [Candidatus Ozemobacteraceae bacterium]
MRVALEQKLEAAWLRVDETDVPMNPVVVGPPGCGKTSLIAAMAQKRNQPLYIYQCTMDTRPEDLIITPVLEGDQKIRYQASSLVSAMIAGGICILDEGNRMRDKAWASLASLLDTRRYVESIIAGIKIPAHRDFRGASTMNEDTSTFQLPDYIRSRLRPRIEVPEPDEATLEQVIRSNHPYVTEPVVSAVTKYLAKRRQENAPTVSTRQAVQLAAYTFKRQSLGETGSLPELIHDGFQIIVDTETRSNRKA